MFHKIKNIFTLSEYCLSAQLVEKCTKIYRVKPLFERIPVFSELMDGHLFLDVTIDVGGME